MPLWVPILVSAAVAIALALLTYLVNGLLASGKIIGSVQQEVATLSAQGKKTASDVDAIRTSMLSPSHLEAAIAKLQVEFYREMQAGFKEIRASRATDQARQ